MFYGIFVYTIIFFQNIILNVLKAFLYITQYTAITATSRSVFNSNYKKKKIYFSFGKLIF